MDIKAGRRSVLIASIFINLCLGSFYAWSIFAFGFMSKFNWTLDTVTTVFVIGSFVGPIANILGGRIMDKRGAKTASFLGTILYAGGYLGCGFSDSITSIYIMYICIAAGMSFSYMTTLNNTIKFFPERKGLISGIMTGCMGFSTIVIAPLAQKLISSTDITITYRVFGVAFFVIMIVCSFFLKTAPSEPIILDKKSGTGNDTGKVIIEKTPIELLKTPFYYVLTSMIFIGGFAGLTMTSQAALAAQEMVQVSASIAAIAVSWFSFSSASGKILWGFISDKIGRYNSLVLIFVVLLIGEAVLSTVHAGGWIQFVIGIVCVAFSYGGFMGTFPVITAENFGFKNQGANYGLVACGFSLGGIVGPKITVYLKDIGNMPYRYSFMTIAVVVAAGLVIAIMVRIKKG